MTVFHVYDYLIMISCYAPSAPMEEQHTEGESAMDSIFPVDLPSTTNGTAK